MALACPLKNEGRGRPIICPMDTYISGIRKTKLTMSRCFISFNCVSIGFSRFTDAACCTVWGCVLSTFTLAPYPAWVTAVIISSVESLDSSNSTCILLVKRFTVTSSMPSNWRTHFSTREEQAEQVMPVTSNFSFKKITSLLKIHDLE